MSEVTIRKATIDDAAHVAELSGILGYPVNAETMRQRLEGVLGSNAHAVFVAEINGQIVGWTEAAEVEILVAARRCELEGLVVADGQRGHGVGRKLVEAVEQWSRSRGLDQISLRSNVVRPESHSFYERIGYERFKTQHAYRKRIS
jgi:GNAT superfamily N-acetyltransferase